MTRETIEADVLKFMSKLYDDAAKNKICVHFVVGLRFTTLKPNNVGLLQENSGFTNMETKEAKELCNDFLSGDYFIVVKGSD